MSSSRVLELGHAMDREAPTPAIERIAGLYPRGFMSIVAAQAGTGKTWFMQYLACRLSMGGNILAGLVPKSKRYKSVIMAGETGKDLLNLRLKATCWDYSKERIRIYDAVEMQIAEIPIMLNSPEGRTTFVEILDHEKPDIVFFDTLISFHTADESKQGEMTSIYTFLLKLANAFNCAIVMNHHTRKRSTKQVFTGYTQDDVIGSSAGVRLASSVYILTQEKEALTEGDEGMPLVRVSNVKSWDKRVPDFSYRFYTDELTDKLDFAIDWGVPASEAWSLRERVQRLIESHEAGAMITTEAVASELVTSKDSARKYLDEFTKKGKLERIKVMNSTAWRVLA